MNYTYNIIDVFTNQPFNGAQLAVFPEAKGLNDQQMALVACELNLTETIFLTKTPGNENHFRMKIFSPLGEIDSSGHPIIAAAYTLAFCDKLILKDGHTPVTFLQNIGEILANVSSKGGIPSLVQYTRTTTPIVDYFTPTETELASFLGIDAAYIDNKKYSTRLVSCGLVPYLVVPTFYYETVREAKFDLAAWSQSIAPQTAAQAILLVSPKTPYKDSDFAARLVGPNIGVNDDPPVGFAMSALAAFLCSFSHMQKGTYTFAVQRGDEKMRRSVLNLEMDHKGEDTLTIRVGGEAVKVAEGTIFVPSV